MFKAFCSIYAVYAVIIIYVDFPFGFCSDVFVDLHIFLLLFVVHGFVL